MLDWLLLLLKIVAVPVLGLFLIFVYLHLRILSRISFYEKQGVVTYPGAKTFVIGNLLDLMAYGASAAKSTQEKVEPLPNPSLWIANRFMAKRGHGKHDEINGGSEQFDGVKYPFVFFNKLTMPQLMVSDPDAVKDLYVTKNGKTDKDGFTELMFKDLIGNSFIFSFNDKRWKEKRKACAHAFYKERLNQMLEVLKEKVIEHIERHIAKIKESPDSSSIMDFEHELSAILSRNIVHICFGIDLCHEKLTMRIQEKKNGPWVWRKFHIPEAIGHLIDQMNTSYGYKFYNPINWLAPYTLRWFDFSAYNAVYVDNAQRIREFIEGFVMQRKKGLIKSTVKQDSDLLSLFLSRPDVFSDVDVIDEIIDFFGAASETTQKSLQTFMAHLAKDPESRKRIRDEFKAVIKEKVAEQPELADLPMKDLMKELINFDNVKDLEYLNWVWQEALRYQAPGSASTDLIFKEDTQIGKLWVKAYDRIQVNFSALHFNSQQWQKPFEFIPERFDNSNPISLTPSGKKRNTVSWTPFFGGMRICFGKTVAEANQKIIAIYFSMFFDSEFVDKEKYGQGKAYPLAHFMQSFHPSVLVKLTENKEKYLE